MSPAVAHAPLSSLNSPHAPTAPAGTERPGYTTFLLIRESATDERAREASKGAGPAGDEARVTLALILILTLTPTLTLTLIVTPTLTRLPALLTPTLPRLPAHVLRRLLHRGSLGVE